MEVRTCVTDGLPESSSVSTPLPSCIGNLFLTLTRHLMAIGLAKISILAFYYRVLSRTWSKTLRWVIIGSIVFVSCYTIMAVVRMILLCNPPQTLWLAFKAGSHVDYKAHCKDGERWRITVAAINVLTDFYITLLPLTFIGRLQINQRQKVALYALFALGFL